MNDSSASTVILASAGSGKTYTLTGRFIRLVLLGGAPERILASTFTRKAAGEILSRILSRLASGAESQAGADALCAQVGIAPLPLERVQSALSSVVACLDRLQVGTLDSFLARVAAGAAFESGLPLGWRIAEADVDAALRHRAIVELIDSAAIDDAISVVSLLAPGPNSAGVLRHVEKAVDDAYSIYLESDAAAWSRIVPQGTPATKESLARACDALRAAPVPLTMDRPPKPNATWKNAVEKVCKSVESGNWRAVLHSRLTACVANDLAIFSGQRPAARLLEALRPIAHHARDVLVGELAAANQGIRRVLDRFHDRYSSLKAEAGVATFEDVPRALVEASIGSRLSEVYLRLDSAIDHVLLDEFQDTSITQFELLQPTLEEVLAGQGAASGPRGAMFVGDVKQSLYQWRSAEPAILSGLARRWPQLQANAQNVTRRCAPAVVDTVNAVFGNVARASCFTDQEAALAAARQWAGAFAPHGSTARHAGAARLCVFPEHAAQDALERTKFVVGLIGKLTSEHPGWTVGVLVPTRKPIGRLLHELGAAGIPASMESGNPLIDAPAVAAVLSALQLADHPGDTAAAFHVAHCPLARVLGLKAGSDAGDRSTVARAIRESVLRRGYGPTISAWRDGVASECGERELARLDQLCELAHEFDGRAGLRAEEFVELVRERRVESPAPALVRVMTIHASKGLEFDAVVLPELDHRLSGEITPAIDIERAAPGGPIRVATRHANETLQAWHPELKRVARSALERRISEALSTLYVAMTRARRELVMVVRPKAGWAGKCTYAALLRSTLGGGDELTAGTVPWERTNSGEETAAPPRSAKTPVVVKPPTVVRKAPPAWRLGREAPTSSHPSASDALATFDDRYRDLGSAAHAVLSHFEWFAQPPDRATIIDLAVKAGFPTELATSCADVLVPALASKWIAPLFDPATFGGAKAKPRVVRERSFAVVDRAGTGPARILSGRFDRVVVTSSAAHVVEFKSGFMSHDQAAGTYGGQLDAYRIAAARVFGVPQASVRTWLVILGAKDAFEYPEAPSLFSGRP